MFSGELCQCLGICCCADLTLPPTCAWCGGPVITGNEDVCAACLEEEDRRDVPEQPEVA